MHTFERVCEAVPDFLKGSGGFLKFPRLYCLVGVKDTCFVLDEFEEFVRNYRRCGVGCPELLDEAKALRRKLSVAAG